MKKDLIVKNKIIYKIESHLKDILSKKYNFNVPTIPGIPFLMNIVNVSAINRAGHHYPGKGIKMLICIFEDDCNLSRWLIDKNECLRLGKKLFKEKDFIRKVARDFKVNSKKFYNFIRYLENNGIKSFRFKDDFLYLLDLYLSQFGIIYPITSPITFGYSDYFMEKFFRKYNYSDLAHNAIKIFTQSTENFLLDEENDLKKILNKIIKKRIKLKSLNELKEKHQEIYNLLSKHQKSYYWISNNYKDTRKLNIGFFFRRLKSIGKDKKEKIALKDKVNTKKLYRKIDREEIEKLKLFGKIAGFQDQRKKSNIIANYWLIEFLKRIARRYKINFSLLQQAILSEILILLETNKIDIKKLRERRRGMINFSFQNKDHILTNRDFKVAKRILESMLATKNTIFLRGFVANMGMAVGRARVIINVTKEAKKIKDGDILVTSMTRPEFVPYLKLAKAIITDEGGITSHAAVVSRELGIPCIIATKIATKVLKDGDLVEVDANKGVVKILKK